MKPKKNFLVTGTEGYIGSHMCWELKQAYPHSNIIGIDNRRGLLDENLCISENLTDKFFFSDLCNFDESLGLYPNDTLDCVFHFAAYASVPEGEVRKYAYYKNNLKSTLGIMDLALVYKARNFILSSTCAVHGNSVQPGYLIKENFPRYANSVYGKTKIICEDIVQSQNQIPVGILRYFNAAGRNQEADLRENHNPETHLIPILHRNDKIKVFGTDYDTQDGTAIRDYMHVVDICQAHIKAYEYMDSTRENITCNLGTGIGHSVADVILKCSEIYGKKYEIEKCPRREGDAPYLVADNSIMKNTLKFLPKYDIVDIIKSMN